jgi:hypothetical protein
MATRSSVWRIVTVVPSSGKGGTTIAGDGANRNSMGQPIPITVRYWLERAGATVYVMLIVGAWAGTLL